ncbi:MAG: precorrin-3B C(17)-methyltransferase [Pseudomonadales bacterium]|uniref:Precorrin-3B C17-methyltransferase region protein n=1 Tax=Oleiphilus messinensis TaxID=141451 RepID=A0A1Y0I9I0_9GAMM|nr:precorrin-3B C(17)-methyltransferase [Oleiphilus messinensis]ARU56809.1 precorrin-3B C17-methyltransferase region protein [Oleiphilus messinensis]MCG8610778.1 precorrin-3B C(17)-methyltransferase [Pseudomonadales bacterium]
MSKTLHIVGTGPGDLTYLPPLARQAIAESDGLVAYPLYIDLIQEQDPDLITGKQRHDLPLGEEIERARLALDLAAEGQTIALISSGDIGIFAMATLVFELLDRECNPRWVDIDVQVIPGISAMQTAASKLGAPLGHDFCAISLSDLLTPWPTIETRVRAAGMGDFVVSFYNPVSRKRDWQLAKARELLLEYRPAETPVILGRNLSRKDEKTEVTTLGALDTTQVDMLTVVVIGNSESRTLTHQQKTWVYTPRGYAKKLEG